MYATPYDILKMGTQHTCISDVGIKGTLDHVRLQIPDMRHQPIEVLDDSYPCYQQLKHVSTVATSDPTCI